METQVGLCGWRPSNPLTFLTPLERRPRQRWRGWPTSPILTQGSRHFQKCYNLAGTTGYHCARKQEPASWRRNQGINWALRQTNDRASISRLQEHLPGQTDKCYMVSGISCAVPAVRFKIAMMIKRKHHLIHIFILLIPCNPITFQFNFFLEMVSIYVAQCSLKNRIFLSRPPKS